MISDCPSTHQFLEFVQEQVYQAQTRMVPRPGHDSFSNTYNPGWRNHPNFSWKTHPVTNTMLNRPNFQETNFRPRPYAPQPQPNNYEPTFEAKVLQALKGLEEHTQILNSHTQSITKLETQIGQLATALSRREEGKLPSQPISNPVRSYKAESSTSPANFPEQAKVVMTLRSRRTLNQPDLDQEHKTTEPEKPSHAKGKEPID